MHTKHITTWRDRKPQVKRPWFGIGPTNDGGKVNGVSLSLGSRCLALHRSVTSSD